jgi:hypothetical protein
VVRWLIDGLIVLSYYFRGMMGWHDSSEELESIDTNSEVIIEVFNAS